MLTAEAFKKVCQIHFCLLISSNEFHKQNCKRKAIKTIFDNLLLLDGLALASGGTRCMQCTWLLLLRPFCLPFLPPPHPFFCSLFFVDATALSHACQGTELETYRARFPALPRSRPGRVRHVGGVSGGLALPMPCPRQPGMRQQQQPWSGGREGGRGQPLLHLPPSKLANRCHRTGHSAQKPGLLEGQLKWKVNQENFSGWQGDQIYHL